jgi:hypothetical protein
VPAICYPMIARPQRVPPLLKTHRTGGSQLDGPQASMFDPAAPLPWLMLLCVISAPLGLSRTAALLRCYLMGTGRDQGESDLIYSARGGG